MRDYIAYQYQLGRLTAEQVRSLAPRWITVAEAEDILASYP